MGSENLHEPYDLLSPQTRDLHRAIVSLMEELEAVDWYQQRAEATHDAELRATLEHHRDEEIEHAMMNLEWLRRNHPTFDENARTYLFSKGPITAVEEAATGGASDRGTTEGGDGDGASSPSSSGVGGSLGIGSLKLT